MTILEALNNMNWGGSGYASYEGRLDASDALADATGDTQVNSATAISGQSNLNKVMGSNGPVQVDFSKPDFNQDTNVPDQSQNQTNNSNAATRAALNAPIKWQTVVKGALFGMMTGAAAGAGTKNIGTGMAAGSKAEGEQVEAGNVPGTPQNATKIKFQTLQAAQLAAQAHMDNMKAQAYPQQVQDEHNDHVMDQVDKLSKYLGAPTAVTPNTAAAANQTLQDQHNEKGGVPPGLTLGTTGEGGQLFHWDMNSAVNNGGAQKVINDRESILGQAPTVFAPSKAGSTEQAQQISRLNEVVQSWGITSDSSKLQGMVNDKAQIDHLLEKPNDGTTPALTAQREAATKQLGQDIDISRPIVDKAKVGATAAAKDKGTLEGTQEAAKTVAANTPEAIQAKAKAAQQEDLAKQKTPQGRAELAKTYQETQNAKYANAEKHQQALFNEGKDPVTHVELSLSNAQPEMLVDQRTGQPIPWKMTTVLKPTSQESNRADFAASAIHSIEKAKELVGAGKLNGPLSSQTEKTLHAAGMGTAEIQSTLDYISFAQSAATGAHVGGRFNNAIMDKMSKMVDYNMNTDQFQGAANAIEDVMHQYIQTGGRETVASYKQDISDIASKSPKGTGALDQKTAGYFLNAAGGDKNKARAAAKTNGYTF